MLAHGSILISECRLVGLLLSNTHSPLLIYLFPTSPSHTHTNPDLSIHPSHTHMHTNTHLLVPVQARRLFHAGTPPFPSLQTPHTHTFLPTTPQTCPLPHLLILEAEGKVQIPVSRLHVSLIIWMNFKINHTFLWTGVNLIAFLH